MNFNPEKGKPNKETKEERKGFVKRAVSFLKETTRFPSYFIKREKLIYYLKNEEFEVFEVFFNLLSKEEKEKLKADERFQKKLRVEIVVFVWKLLNIPQLYIDLASEETFQEGLKIGIEKLVKNRLDIPKGYIDFASKETIEEFKTDKAFQKKLKIGIGKMVEDGLYIPQGYLDLANEKTLEWFRTSKEFQEKLKIGNGKRIENRLDISQGYIDFASKETIEEFKTDEAFQEKLKIGIARCIKYNQYIPQDYLKYTTKETFQEALKIGYGLQAEEGHYIRGLELASDKTLQELRYDEVFQKKLRTGIKISMSRANALPDVYTELANEKTLQEGLKDGIKELIKRGRYISHHFIDLLDENTFRELFSLIVEKSIAKGYSIYFGLNKDKVARLFSSLERSKKEELTTNLITSFFHNSETVRSTVEQLIKEKTNEEIEQILFDKTELAMGIKLHTEEGSPYGKFLNSTGGFHAHGQDTTWVANPLPNQKATELAFEVLEKLKEESGYEGDYGYIQTTFPKRLDNKYASIATIAHMFTKDYFETKEGIDQLITHNQDTKGITIYDAGRVITDKYTVPNEKGEASVPSWEGRTDVLLSDTLNDVKNIRTVMTLLVHASEDKLAFSSLGKEFIQEVKDILKTSSHIDLDKVTENITFVGDGVNPHTLGSFLSQIAEMREDLNQRYTNYEKGRNYLNSLEEGTEDYEKALHTLEKLYRNLTTHPSTKLRELITKYRETMFSKGYFHELYGWKDEHEKEKLKKVVGEQVERIQEDGIILN